MSKHHLERHHQVHRRSNHQGHKDQYVFLYHHHHHHQRRPLQSNQQLLRLAKSRYHHHHSNVQQDHRLCARIVVVADVMCANSHGRYLRRGYVTIIVFARRTQLLTTPHVCAASKVYFIIVRMTMTAVNLARTNRAVAVLRKGRLVGAVLQLYRVCYRVYCVICHFRRVKDSLKRVTQGIHVKDVGVHNLQHQKNVYWTLARTFNLIITILIESYYLSILGAIVLYVKNLLLTNYFYYYYYYSLRYRRRSTSLNFNKFQLYVASRRLDCPTCTYIHKNKYI